jgi:hypothetical protein
MEKLKPFRVQDMVEAEITASSGVIQRRIAPGDSNTRRWLSLDGDSMSTSTMHSEKAEESIPDQDRADKASDAFMVGVDQHGREHYHSRIRDRMTVLNDGEHVHTEPLNGRPLSDWMAFIESDDQCGWRTKNTFSGSVADHLCDQLSAGFNGGEY